MKTNQSEALSYLRLLAHDLRWEIVQAVRLTDMRVSEIVAQVGQPSNLVSYHLRQLREGDVVTARRSAADGRDIYYTLNTATVRAGLDAMRAELLSEPAPLPATSADSLRVLFLCTHNSARSQMAEGLMNAISGGQVSAVSAGFSPTSLKQDAIVAMHSLGIDISQQAAKPLTHFEQQRFDYVITVCDRARELLPAFDGAQQRLHWGMPPATGIEAGAARQQAYAGTAHHLRTRIDDFLSFFNLGGVA